jgi:cold shock CspA family protein
MTTETAETKFPFADKRIEGKVIMINKRGYGFISSKEVPYTRIYFHWTNLIPQTINFAEIKRGDPVDFLLEKKDDGTFKAIKVDVLEREKPVAAEVKE